MDKQAVKSARAPAPVGPYSQAIVAGGFVFCSGQIPIDPKEGEITEGDVSVQTTAVMENLRAVLEAAGCTLENVVKTTIFLADMNDFVKVNKVYASYFGENPPARSTVEVAGLPKDDRVEIECIAIK